MRGGGKSGSMGGAGQGVAPQYLTKNVRRYQTNVETPMMTATMRTVTDTQMAMKIFFCGRVRSQRNSFRWGRRAIQGRRGDRREGSPSVPSSGSPGPS